MDVKFQVFLKRIEFQGSVRKLEFSRAMISFSEIFQVILIENHASIHHNLIEADKSRPQGHFSDLLSMGIFAVCQFSKAIHSNFNHSNFTSIPLYGYFLE